MNRGNSQTIGAIHSPLYTLALDLVTRVQDVKSDKHNDDEPKPGVSMFS